MTKLIKNIGRLVTVEASNDRDGELGVIQNAAIRYDDSILWFGPESNLPKAKDKEVIDACGGVVIPGFIDCHTHLIHGGSRQHEFAKRARGVSYAQIAKEGGGIISTVNATRAESSKSLFQSAKERVSEALKMGTTTFEVKSGYGLDADTEFKILEVAEKLEKELPARFVSTFLGAHTIPSEYKNNRDRYIDIIINEMLPKVKKYKNCKFCDVFVENIAFTIDEARKICDAARAIGLRPRLHVDQLTAGGGALLAAEVDAISADHLEYVSDDGIKQLAQNGIVAVMLPGAAYFIKEKQQAPARKLIDAGVTVAVATDYNPGSNPCLNLFLTANMAISLMNMTVEESIKGITINAAKALDLDSKLGSIAVGKKADLLILNTSDEFMPFYRYDKNFVSTVIINGHTIKF